MLINRPKRNVKTSNKLQVHKKSAVDVDKNIRAIVRELAEITRCVYRSQRLVKGWSKGVQCLVDQYGLEVVRSVVEWFGKSDREWLHVTPYFFINHFGSLLVEFRQSVNPYSSEELRPIMEQLNKLTWECDPDQLELCVGRSLFQVNLVQDRLIAALGCESDVGLVKFLLGQIDNAVVFVQLHFESRFGMSLRRVEITESEMRRYLAVWARLYGVSSNKYLESIYGERGQESVVS